MNLARFKFQNQALAVPEQKFSDGYRPLLRGRAGIRCNSNGAHFILTETKNSLEADESAKSVPRVRSPVRTGGVVPVKEKMFTARFPNGRLGKTVRSSVSLLREAKAISRPEADTPFEENIENVLVRNDVSFFATHRCWYWHL